MPRDVCTERYMSTSSFSHFRLCSWLLINIQENVETNRIMHLYFFYFYSVVFRPGIKTKLIDDMIIHGLITIRQSGVLDRSL